MLFDFGGTLDADGIPWKERFFRLCSSHGVAVSPERFDPVFYAADDALVGAVSPTLSFREIVGRLASAVLAGLGHRDDAVAGRIATRFLDDARTHLARNAALLSRLRGRYRLGIVSNFYGNLTRVCEDGGIVSLLDVIVDSAQVGCTKPDPRIFQAAVAGLGIPATQVTFVGDSLPRDMRGALGAGLPHVWLAGEGTEERAACCPGDPVIRRLTDLETVLA